MSTTDPEPTHLDHRPPQPHFLYLDDHGSSASDDADASGIVLAIRVLFQVSGLGSFTANGSNTANGDSELWVRPGTLLRLAATAGPHHRFTHWTLNGLPGGFEPTRNVAAKAGLTIQAVFTPVDSLAGSDDTRSIIHGWELKGPGKSSTSTAPQGIGEVKFTNSRESDFDVEFFLNDQQLGLLGPGRNHTVSCRPGDRAKVKSGLDAKTGKRSVGVFAYT